MPRASGAPPTSRGARRERRGARAAASAADALLGDPRRLHPVAGLRAASRAALERVAYAPTRGARRASTRPRSSVARPRCAGACSSACSPRTRWRSALAASPGRRSAAARWRARRAARRRARRARRPRRRRAARCRSLVRPRPDGARRRRARAARRSSRSPRTPSTPSSAPLFWGAVAGPAGRAALPRREHARRDGRPPQRALRALRLGRRARSTTSLNWPGARLGALLAALLAPLVGGSPRAALRVARRDGAAHPSPNAGRDRGRVRRRARPPPRRAARLRRPGRAPARARRRAARPAPADVDRARSGSRPPSASPRRAARCGRALAEAADEGRAARRGHARPTPARASSPPAICRWLRAPGRPRRAVQGAEHGAELASSRPTAREIGRAQAMQAAAAGIEPEAAMNPVLIKPSGDRHSQVMRHGPAVRATPTRAPTRSSSPSCGAVVARGARRPARALRRRRLRGRRQPGRDQPARRATSRTWAWRARPDLPGRSSSATSTAAASSPSLLGTLALLEPEDQALHRRLRDQQVPRRPERSSRPAWTQLAGAHRPPDARRAAVARRTCASTPRTRSRSRRRAPRRRRRRHARRRRVRLRWMSNFTDVDALAAEPGVRVRFTRSPADVERADLVVLPGTKATVEDLERPARRRPRPTRSRARRAAARSSASAAATRCSASAIDDDVESRRGARRRPRPAPGRRRRFAPEKLLRRVQRARVWWRRRRPATRSATAGSTPRRRAAARATTASRRLPVGDVLGTSWHGAARGRRVPPRAAGLGRGARAAALRRPARRAVRRRRARRTSTASPTWSPTTSTPTASPTLIERGAPTDCPTIAHGGARVLRLLTTADTEILADGRTPSSGCRDDFPEVRCANPAALDRTLVDDVLDGARVVVVPPARRAPRLARGRRRAARRAARATAIALLALGGEAEPDAELTALSLAPAGRGRPGRRVPAPRRRRQHRAAAALPGRHVPARGPRLRAAARARRPRRLRARRRRRPIDGRSRARPGAPDASASSSTARTA